MTSLQDITKLQGEAVTYKCQATGNPLPTLIWLKDGKVISSLKYSSAGGLSILHLVNLTVSNGGKYTCLASNVVGNTTTTSTLTVYGKFAVTGS